MAEEREQWGRQLEFVLTLIGYAVGLGNVWRFPYLCYRSGGGAFLIPYIISLMLVGIPLFALEVSLGQFGGQGPVTVWSINPAAKGIGMATVAVTFIVMIYYSVIIAWALRFLVASFTSHLPWEDCTSCNCLLYRQNTTGLDLEEFRRNNSFGLDCTNATLPKQPRSPSEVFFTDRVLGKTASIAEPGELQWEILVANLVAYIIVFLVLVKGIQSLGKVVYFTATFPYILLSILLVRGVMLEGAGTGIRYYLEPDWSRLSDASVWSDAAVQIFFSLSACMGGLIAMASYNNFNNNVLRDAFLVPIINCGTSIFAGFVVFATLGYMAHIKDTTVSEVTEQGPGLMFVVYPEAISQMPVSPLWACMFFFTVTLLGFSSQFTFAETVMTSLEDEFPQLRNSPMMRVLERAGVCLICFALGIPMVMGNGQHLLDLIDGAELGYPLLLIGLAELIIIISVYGYANFAEDIRSMVGYRPPFYFKLCWDFISPVLLLGVVVFKAYQQTRQEVQWADLIYWLAAVFPVFLMPAWWFYYTCVNSQLTKHTPEWRSRRMTPHKNVLENYTDPDFTLDVEDAESKSDPSAYPEQSAAVYATPNRKTVEMNTAPNHEVSDAVYVNTSFEAYGEDINVKL